MQVGHTYGRRMLKGMLESKGIKVSESRVAESLLRVAPSQYDQRRNDTLDRLNPSMYNAVYFGQKVHIDQNEKLKMFGVTHIIARDGFSGKIVSYCTMPVKNNLAIYESIFRYNFSIGVCLCHTTSRFIITNLVIINLMHFKALNLFTYINHRVCITKVKSFEVMTSCFTLLFDL